MSIITLLRHRLVRIYQSYFPEPLTTAEHELVREKLTPSLHALFYAQPLCDQRHGLLVYKKCQSLFLQGPTLSVDNPPTDDELFLASCFHDVAKKDCRFSVTQRVIVATAVSCIPVRRHDALRFSKSKLLRRIGIYVDHAELSWDLIKGEVASEFVHDATVFHHGHPKDVTPPESQARNLELFVVADTL